MSKKSKQPTYYIYENEPYFIAEDGEPIWFGVAEVEARSTNTRFPTPSLQAKALEPHIEHLMSFEDKVYTFSKTMRTAHIKLIQAYKDHIGE